MADRVQVEQAIGTVETARGTRQWVDDGPAVAGMVAAGFWTVVDRQGGRQPRTRKTVEQPEEVTEDGPSGDRPAEDAG